MNLPTDQILNLSYFTESALTYFQYGTALEINNGVREISGQNKILRYPISNVELDVKVNMTKHQILFWSVVGKYLPNGSYVSNAYVSPNKQAKVGLGLLEDKSISLDKFKGKITNPELVGKYKEHYLYEFDYVAIQNTLNSFSLKWARPNTSIHQRGLAIDIKSNNIDCSSKIINWFKDNISELHITNILKQDDNNLHVEFSEKILNKQPSIGNTYFLNNSFDSGVSKSLDNKVDSFYNILKSNGHKNLEDTGLPAHALSRLPETSKKQAYFLAKAIKEILDDALGGKNGIISKLVQDELEYVLGLVNGLIGAVTTLGVELDTITDGRASKLIREAIESEAAKTANSQLIRNKLITFSPILSKDYPALLSSNNKEVHDTNIKNKEKLIEISRSNNSDSYFDTKNTPNNTNKEYDNLRSNNSGVIILGYDHYLTIDDNKLDYYELKINNTYEISIFSQNIVSVSHMLNKKVSVSCQDVNGNNVTGNITIIDNNNLSIEFNPAFTGKIIVS